MHHLFMYGVRVMTLMYLPSAVFGLAFSLPRATVVAPGTATFFLGADADFAGLSKLSPYFQFFSGCGTGTLFFSTSKSSTWKSILSLLPPEQRPSFSAP